MKTSSDYLFATNLSNSERIGITDLSKKSHIFQKPQTHLEEIVERNEGSYLPDNSKSKYFTFSNKNYASQVERSNILNKQSNSLQLSSDAKDPLHQSYQIPLQGIELSVNLKRNQLTYPTKC